MLRQLYSIPGVHALIKRISFMFVPRIGFQMLRVRSGLGQGLRLQLHPRWEVTLWEGTYEVPVQYVLGAFLKPGYVFYDVGGDRVL